MVCDCRRTSLWILGWPLIFGVLVEGAGGLDVLVVTASGWRWRRAGDGGCAAGIGGYTGGLAGRWGSGTVLSHGFWEFRMS